MMIEYNVGLEYILHSLYVHVYLLIFLFVNLFYLLSFFPIFPFHNIYKMLKNISDNNNITTQTFKNWIID